MTDTRYVHTLDRVSILPIDNGNYVANRGSADRSIEIWGYRLNVLADIACRRASSIADEYREYTKPDTRE